MSIAEIQTPKRATIDDLMNFEGKAELIDGEVVPDKAKGYEHGRISKRLLCSLDDYAEDAGIGQAIIDNVAYRVPELPSGRESFSPDASLYLDGPPLNPWKFIDGFPIFAAEVRSECDYGPAAERAMAAKRDDYFAAAQKWFGTSIPIRKPFMLITPIRRILLAYSKPAKSLMRSPFCRIGGSKSIGSSDKILEEFSKRSIKVHNLVFLTSSTISSTEMPILFVRSSLTDLCEPHGLRCAHDLQWFEYRHPTTHGVPTV